MNQTKTKDTIFLCVVHVPGLGYKLEGYRESDVRRGEEKPLRSVWGAVGPNGPDRKRITGYSLLFAADEQDSYPDRKQARIVRDSMAERMQALGWLVEFRTYEEMWA